MVGSIILNYNNPGLTIDCVNSILKYNTFPLKILVVDNASTDDSIEILASEMSKMGDFCQLSGKPVNNQKLPPLSLIRSESNDGYASGNNVGLEVFEKDEEIEYTLILNNDVLFIDDIIPKLVDFIRSHEESALVSPLLLAKDGRTVDSNCARKDCYLREVFWYYMLYTKNYFGLSMHYRIKRKMFLQNPDLLNLDKVQMELPSGSCMIIRKDLFKKMGYFDAATFLFYEENILFRKTLAQQKINYVLPQLKCIHLGCQTAKKAVKSSDYLYKCNKSAIYYALTYRKLNFISKNLLKFAYLFYLNLFNLRQGTKYRPFWEQPT